MNCIYIIYILQNILVIFYTRHQTHPLNECAVHPGAPEGDMMVVADVLWPITKVRLFELFPCAVGAPSTARHKSYESLCPMGSSRGEGEELRIIRTEEHGGICLKSYKNDRLTPNMYPALICNINLIINHLVSFHITSNSESALFTRFKI